MRFTHALAIIFLFGFLTRLDISAEAGWGSIFKIFTKSHVDDAMRSTSHGIDGFYGRSFPEARELLKNSSAREAENFGATLGDLHRYTPPGHYSDDLSKLREAIKSYTTNPSDFDRAIPLSEKFPYLQLRSHHSAVYDSAIRSFSRARYEDLLAERFDVKDLKIVALGMSDDTAMSASEVARFRRHVGRNVLDEVGPLADLSSQLYKTSEAKIAALAPYRGKTVIVVGHIPDDIGEFFIFNSAGRARIDIGDWMAAASEAGVNLIPLGCNSERLARLGARGAINSGTVLERLRLILSEQPHTIGDFFGKLTGEDLILLMDPLKFQVHSNALQIISREKNELIGHIIAGGVRSSGRMLQSQRTAISPQDNVYDICFKSEDRVAFTGCVADIKIEMKRQQEKIIAISEAQSRQRARHSIPAELIDLEKDMNSKLRMNMGMTILYLLIWPMSSFIFIHAVSSARFIEQEAGASWGAVFSRLSVRSGLRNISKVLRNPLQSFESFILLLFFLTAGPLVFFDLKLFSGERFLLLLIIASCFFVFLSLVWEVAKTAVREKSFSSFVAVSTAIVFFGAFYMKSSLDNELKLVFDSHGSLSQNLEYLSQFAEQDARILASVPRNPVP